MNILVVTLDYPNRNIVHYPFVKQIVDEFARQGHSCFVIAPYSLTNNRRFYKAVENDGDVVVYRPNYLSFSNLKIGKFQFSDIFRRRAIKRAIKWLPVKPDFVYCHFWKCAFEALSYSRTHQIPLFVASGESSIASFLDENYHPSKIKNYVSGVICVSSKNKEESISLGLTTTEKCFVSPNSVNSNLFKKIDKSECRNKLGIPEDVFIVSFVGAFINRKGSKRVSEAISRINGERVFSIFIGKGEQEPTCENILFKGSLPHEEIPVYLNASDVFVLPTLAEGCSNAIVEAMSCGLPIVSSNLPFNWDVLDNDNSIMIDPNDVGAIANAIVKLRDDKELRRKKAIASLEKAKALTIEQRARNIISFITTKINNCSF